MSDVLFDFVDRPVGDDDGSENYDDDDGAIAMTTEIDSWWLVAGNNTDDTEPTTGEFGSDNDNDNANVDANVDDNVDDNFCSVPTEIFEDFAAENFSNTHTIRWMHSIPPRFGYTKNVLDLMVGTNAQQQEYVKGLFAPAMALMVFFLAWALVLLIFKLLAPPSGSNSTRWLGGQPLRMPSPPTSNKDDYDDKTRQNRNRRYNDSVKETPAFKEWKQEYNDTRYKHFVFKIIVWVAGLSITIAALVMSVYGVDSLTNTLEAGRESIDIARSLAGDAQVIVDSIISENRDLSKKVYGMLQDVNGMCPLIRDPLCDDIYNITTCDISAFLGTDLNNIFQLAGGHFVDGEESEYFLDIVNAKNGLEDAQLVSKDMDHSAAQLNWALSLSMVMSILLAMLCILILCGLICPEVPKVLQCIRSRFMIPTFVFLVFFAYFFSLVFVTASIATADICIYHNETDNIDERLTALLTGSKTFEELLGGKENQNLVVEFISFYIHQCPVEMLPSEILEQLDYLQVGVPLIQDFGTIVEESTELIRGVCGFGTDQTQDLVSVAGTLQDQLCSVVAILTDLRDFVQCGNWYPLYETTVYEALCYDGTKGFAYVASTQFVIVFMAFVILTCRVAFWEIQVGDEFFDFVEDDYDDDNRSYESSSYYSGSSNSKEREETETRGFRFYRSLRNKLGHLRSPSPPLSSQYSDSESRMSETMEERTEKGGWQGNNAYLSRTATTTSTPSDSSSSPEQLQLKLPSRNSIYPSRRFSRGETTVVSPTRIAVVGTTTGLECGEEGIEVVEQFTNTYPNTNAMNNTNNTAVLNRTQEIGRSGRNRESSSSNFRSGGGNRSPSADATSLWAKHWDNIDYVDSDNDDDYSGSYDGSGYYSYGDVDNDLYK